MLKEVAELLEREYPVLAAHPWLAALAIFVAGVFIVASWLVTA
jgi:hypothetical protein